MVFFPSFLSLRLPWTLVVILAVVTLREQGRAADRSILPLRSNDVVALVGSAALVAEQRSGELETALLRTHPELHLHVQNFAWEGDTASNQPREVNYPSLTRLLKEHHATITFVQFGQSEAIANPNGQAEFRRAYLRLLDELASVTPRLVLVTPTRLETLAPPLPPLALQNAELSRYVSVILEIATQRQLAIIDLYHLAPEKPLTTDGRQLSVDGRGTVALAFVRGILPPNAAALKTVPNDAARWFAQPELRTLREAVVEKNQLWFHYVRPTNWAFLAGDRTEQLSSRDHRDRSVRWFPAEMEQFIPLLHDAEHRLDRLSVIPSASETR